MKNRLVMIAAAALAALLVSLSAATAGGLGYMKVVGQKQGVLEGPVTDKKWAGTMPVLATAFEITAPRDPSSGLPTGRVRYGGLTVTKAVDSATPQLFQAAATNEALTSVLIQYVASNANGEEAVAHTITLGQAQVVGVTQYIGQADDPRGLPAILLEDITFSYGTIALDAGGGGPTRGVVKPLKVLPTIKPRVRAG